MTNVVQRYTSPRRKAYYQRQKNQGEATKEKILRIIAESEPNGKSTTELAKDTGLHRDTIHRSCKQLMKKELISKNGRFGKYHITSKSIGSPEISSFLFGSKAMKQFYLFEHPEPQIRLEDQNEISEAKTEQIESILKNWISVNNKFCNNEYCESIVLGKSYEKIIPDRGLKDQLCLFEFAIRIGGIISYEMIQSLRYEGSPIIENNINKDIAAWKWVDNVIKPDLILKAFSELDPVGRILKRNKSDDSPRGPFYEVDKKGDLEQLMRSFKDVFPEIYERLEDIMKGIPGETERLRNYASMQQLKK